MTAQIHPEQFTEEQIRAMRDEVYGHKSSNDNWAGCRENWMQPANVLWLVNQTKTNQ
jgi:hypothetical protein